ncbi:MAG TPA: sugar ABC transporter permease [Thermoanaerobaculia bacterium]|nr:sugar ABC transporter permease [Thermoanaerobaculia bacterium]
METPAPSHRRRFLIGLALAVLLGIGLAALLLSGARASESRARAERRALVTLSALTEVVERAGGGGGEAAKEPQYGLGDDFADLGEEPPAEETGGGLGDELAALDAGEPEAPAGEPGEAVRRAVAAFAKSHPELTAVRVVAFEGIRLEASTAPADTGDKAAPRRLERDEKPLYDVGQRLRAAVSENREEGMARAEEVALERRPDGLVLAAPIERGGEVAGMVQMVTRTEIDPPGAPLLPALLAGLVPVLLLFALSFVLGERRVPLAAAAAVLLVAALLVYAAQARRTLAGDRRATGQAIADAVGDEAEKAEALLAEIGTPVREPLAPELWDVDLFRRPHGLVTKGGMLDEGKLGEEVGANAGRLTRSVVVLALASLALLAFVGLGFAASTGAALVRYRNAYAYTLPAMIGMLLLVFFPFFYGIALSFTNANVYNTDKSIFETWVGLDNFVDILSDVGVVRQTPEGRVFDYTNFYWTLGFTVVWTIANVTIGVSLGLLLALALNTKGLALRSFYRVVLILPWAMPTYITALIWQGMFHRQFGVVNQVLQLFGAPAIAWFDAPLTSFLAVLTTNGWLSFPFMMVVSLGALQSIPADLYEAARVDGASKWQQFRSITLPSLKPALVPAVILSVIWTFNQFNVIYLVSAGQPAGATEILITQAYKLAFEQYRYGYAAAYSTVIFLILLVYGTWQNRVTRATEAIG